MKPEQTAANKYVFDQLDNIESVLKQVKSSINKLKAKSQEVKEKSRS